MVFINLEGRLGNNLFQYAFAVAIQEKLNTKALVYGWDPIFQKYFNPVIDLDFIIGRKIIRKIITKLPFIKTVRQVDFQPNSEILTQISNWTIYDGYFQSQIFFKEAIEKVKSKIKIKPQYITEFQNQFGKLYSENKILAIHCRLGDYINWGNSSLGGKDLSLPESYYINAINSIKNIEDYLIIIVTDDIKNVNENFSFIQNKIVFSEDVIIDFQLLMNADKLIISNSTFSWWAAFLNNKVNEVIAPEYFVGFKIKQEFPEGIIPDNFTKISVY